MKKLFRYIIQYSNIDDPETQVVLTEHQVIRETEKSYFIKPYFSPHKQKIVSKNAHNTFAYDTKEKAMKHFIRRTKNRIRWYKYWIEECENAINLTKDNSQ